MASLSIGGLAFNLVHGYAVYRQALVQDTIHQTIQRAVAENGGGKAVVLAPSFDQVWRQIPQLANIGTWVNQWPPIPPQAQTQTLVLLDAPGAEPKLRSQFPDRKFFRLQLTENADGMIITPLDGPGH